MQEIIRIALGNIIAMIVYESIKTIIYQQRINKINNQLDDLLEKMHKEKNNENVQK